MNMIQTAKKCILHSRIPALNSISSLWWLLAMGSWLRKNPVNHHFEKREMLFEFIASKIGNAAITYLEFGVFKGDSMRHWTTLNTNPQSKFYGFDTFTGLPEAWKNISETLPAGHFSTGGSVPEIADSRVTFIKGKFQDTLPTFLENFSPSHLLVVSCDADLYNSTLFVLTQLNKMLVPGSFLLFDDFGVADHDFRAFKDYSGAYGRTLELLAHAQADYSKIAFKVIS